MAAVVLVGILAGGLLQTGEDVRVDARQCDTASELAEAAEPGDIIEYVLGAMRVTTVACLGADNVAALLATTTLDPFIDADDLDHPRELWYGTKVAPGVRADDSRRRLIVGSTELRAKRVAELEAQEYDCRSFGVDFRLAACTPA